MQGSPVTLQAFRLILPGQASSANHHTPVVSIQGRHTPASICSQLLMVPLSALGVAATHGSSS